MRFLLAGEAKVFLLPRLEQINDIRQQFHGPPVDGRIAATGVENHQLEAILPPGPGKSARLVKHLADHRMAGRNPAVHPLDFFAVLMHAA